MRSTPLRIAAFAAMWIGACARHEPPAPDESPSVAPPEMDPGVAVAIPPHDGPPSALKTATGDTSASASTGADPSLLPQTRDRPRTSDPAFQARAQALWEGIVRDDPDRAMGFFFPLGAYAQVKDIANPAMDWKHRLVAAYARDIHALHSRLAGSPAPSSGPDSGAALAGPAGGAPRFLGLDVPDERGRWVEPGEEYNKIGYFRVFGSELRYEVGGLTQAFDVKSLISWRGEWYVVHLSAIK